MLARVVRVSSKVTAETKERGASEGESQAPRRLRTQGEKELVLHSRCRSMRHQYTLVLQKRRSSTS